MLMRVFGYIKLNEKRQSSGNTNACNMVNEICSYIGGFFGGPKRVLTHYVPFQESALKWHSKKSSRAAAMA
jgi:hypothetical protein